MLEQKVKMRPFQQEEELEEVAALEDALELMGIIQTQAMLNLEMVVYTAGAAVVEDIFCMVVLIISCHIPMEGMAQEALFASFGPEQLVNFHQLVQGISNESVH